MANGICKSCGGTYYESSPGARDIHLCDSCEQLPSSERPDKQPLKRQVGTIDLTPTWRGVLPMLLAGIENGTPESRKIAIEELQKMAEAADLYNASIPKDAG